ncbi:MAG: NYN domain-containing protein [Candidatus Thorarchaeota archaeon]|nr:MAG: hypothetical protein DRO87_06220 [Candidatus Thorarchaeota archaeon]
MSINSDTSVAVFWDIENCPPPRGMSGTAVEKRLRENLCEYGPIRQVYAYAELHQFPANLRMELQRSGVHLIDTPKGKHEKDVADHMIITDMFLFALENDAPQKMVLISGDIDYAYTLARLRQRLYEVILIIPPVGAPPILKEQADIILEWTVVMGRKKVDGSGAVDWIDTPALKFETLRNALEELKTQGQVAPTLQELEEYLNSRYPAWRKSSGGLDSVAAYVREAELDNWVTTKTSGSLVRVRLVTGEEDSDEVPDVAEDRFAPLVQVLKDAEERGILEPELAYLGVQLRSLMNNPLEKLQVSQLKDYVEEAESAGVITIRRDGLQNYVSLVGNRKKPARKTLAREEKEILDLLERSLDSIAEDELRPTARAVIGRMRELNPDWDLYKSCYGSIPNLLKAAQEKRGIVVEASPPGYLVFPKSGKFPYVDSSDKDYDPFTEEQWAALREFLESHPDIVARGRYGLAKRLKREQVPGISDLKIGMISHLVQLAINKGWLTYQWNKVSVSPIILQ